MLKNQTSYPFVHLIAVMLTPVLFACSHANTEVVAEDGYEAVAGENLAQLSEPEVMDGFNAPPAPEVIHEAITQPQKPPATKSARRVVLAPSIEAKPLAREVATQTPVVSGTLASELEPKTVVREGEVLNRYYFVRAGDTAEGLSKLFYGSPERATELTKWNGAEEKWSTGQVIYYRSGERAQDPSLLSYYFEAGIPTESVQLKAGETLESIAMEKLGSEKSWREIAAVNGLHDGTLLKEGATIQFYAPSFEAAKGAKQEPQMASAQIASFITHNPLLIACTFVALTLLFGFLFFQRRRYRSRFDF